MPRFVILTHDHPFLHWDLLLEQEGVGALRAWRLLAEPLSAPTIDAEPLADHRALYLDYEGPVSGGRGHVVRWDTGDYEIHSLRQSACAPGGSDAGAAEGEAARSSECLELRFAGARIRGLFALEGPPAGEAGESQRSLWRWRSLAE